MREFAKLLTEEHLKYCTVRQAEVVKLLLANGRRVKAAAKELGVVQSAVSAHVKAVLKKAALQGLSPAHDMTREVPDPFTVKRLSTLYGKDGNVAAQWVIAQPDAALAKEALEEWVRWLVKDAAGLAPTITAPKHTDEDLLAVYPMGDPHFGMYAWGEEVGEDFDLGKADEYTRAAVDRLVDVAPNAETALILELGDFFHSDTNENRTARSGNALDVDTRWAKVMQVGLRSMVYCILRALEKHKRVIVRIVKGNHDTHSSYALALALEAWFNNESRVEVILDPSSFWYYQHGKVLIGSTHGDMTKQEQLPGIMAADRKEMWGDTDFRYWYTGHIHHQNVKEYPGVICESFRTLAGADAWHSASGYRSGRDMYVIVHHREHGETERHRCDISHLRRLSRAR